MVRSQRHRGPDAAGTYFDGSGGAALGHNRLSIIDLSPAGAQPMRSADGRYVIALNGEIYNYLELRSALSDYPYRTKTDTEVLLAAFQRWGAACLDRLIGMFAFLVWDTQKQSLFAARDRFGVKPLYYCALENGRLVVASELRAFRAAGIAMEPDLATWATYLTHGLHEHTSNTFWRGIRALPAGHYLTFSEGRRLKAYRWYDLSERIGADVDARPAEAVEDEYRSLLEESVRLRFRADVPVGINLSGGLDSSTLLQSVAAAGVASDVFAFTFVTGDDRYDELPWVRRMLEQTRHELVECRLSAGDVPALAESVSAFQEEPFGGIPTLAYARLFETARSRGVIVLLDGQGMDEQWAGYDYFLSASTDLTATLVQGTRRAAHRPECLTAEFRAYAEPVEYHQPFADVLRNLQYRDLFQTKLPRALRFNDRVSMRASVELREPFLDHRLVELAMRQPADRKIRNGTGKWLLRKLVRGLLPNELALAPKRALQTPQREWLRDSLAAWRDDMIERALDSTAGDWFHHERVRLELQRYDAGDYDSSVFIWQWISVGLFCSQGEVVYAARGT